MIHVCTRFVCFWFFFSLLAHYKRRYLNPIMCNDAVNLLSLFSAAAENQRCNIIIVYLNSKLEIIVIIAFPYPPPQQ